MSNRCETGNSWNKRDATPKTTELLKTITRRNGRKTSYVSTNIRQIWDIPQDMRCSYSKSHIRACSKSSDFSVPARQRLVGPWHSTPPLILAFKHLHQNVCLTWQPRGTTPMQGRACSSDMFHTTWTIDSQTNKNLRSTLTIVDQFRQKTLYKRRLADNSITPTKNENETSEYALQRGLHRSKVVHLSH